MKQIWYSEEFHCWFKLTGVKLYKSHIVPLTGKAEWKYIGTWNEQDGTLKVECGTGPLVGSEQGTLCAGEPMNMLNV